MQFKTPLALSLLASSAAATDNLHDQCIVGCLQPALAQLGCSVDRVSCLCPNLDAILQASGICLSQTCSLSQAHLDALKQEATAQCSNPGTSTWTLAWTSTGTSPGIPTSVILTTAPVSHHISKSAFSNRTIAVHNGTTTTSTAATASSKSSSKSSSKPSSSAASPSATATTSEASSASSAPAPTKTNGAGRANFGLAVLGFSIMAAFGL